MIGRRWFLGAAASLIAAPPLVRASALMPISTRPFRLLAAREDAEIRDAAMAAAGQHNRLLQMLTKADPEFRLKVGQMGGAAARAAINARFGLAVENGPGWLVANDFLVGISRYLKDPLAFLEIPAYRDSLGPVVITRVQPPGCVTAIVAPRYEEKAGLLFSPNATFVPYDPAGPILTLESAALPDPASGLPQPWR